MLRTYITDEEIDAITSAIYNDDNKTLFKNLPQGIEGSIERQNVIDLAQGQEYYIIPETTMMVRKDGRVLNVKYIRAIKPVWSPREIIVNIDRVVYKFSEIYKQQGWKFNHEDITKTYAKNKWGMTASRSYKVVLKDQYRLNV